MNQSSRSDQLAPIQGRGPYQLRSCSDLGAALEAAGIGAWHAEPGTGLIEATPQARALLGLADTETLSVARLLACIHPDDRDGLKAAAAAILATDTAASRLVEVRAMVGGALRWLRIQTAPPTAGAVPGGITGTIVDMTGEHQRHGATTGPERRLESELAAAWSMFRQLPVAIAVLDSQQRYLYCNEALATLTCLPADVLHHAEQAALLPEFHAATAAELERARDTGTPICERLIHTGLTDDGTPRWLRCSWIPLTDGGAQIPFIVLTIRDVTDHHQAQLELERHRENLAIQARELQMYFQHVPVGLAVIDDQLRYVRVNERFAEMSGQPVAAHPGQSVTALDPSSAPNAVTLIRRALDTGAPVLAAEFSSHGDHPTIAERWWRCSYIPLPKVDGCRQVVCMVQDITAAHRAGQELHDNERRMSALANSVPAMVWSAQIDGDTDYCNQRMCDYFGLPVSELHGDAWLNLIHQADRHDMRRAWREALNTESCFEAELRLRRHDGVHLWHRARIVPHHDGQGRVDRWYATAIDIDATKRTELDLADHARALERSNRELNQFASFISHDLRAPLRMVGTYLDLIAESVASPGQPFIDKAQGALDRMRQLIEAVLAYARLGREVSLHMAYVPAASLIDAACETLAPMVAEHGARIEVDQLPEVYADAVLLGQCVQNLIENAIKHGTAPVHLHIGAQQTDRAESWILRFADDGPGIPEDMRKRVFDPFFRLDAGTDGSGIGLAFGAKIVRLHGGDIWIEESDLGGAAFCLRLRARPCEQ
ncbi:MAG: PAS domain-containing sensor histidine kinase [Planctomycetota bacterium]